MMKRWVFFRKALDLKEQGNISSVMNSYLGYAEILMEHHQYDRAVRMLKAGIDCLTNRLMPSIEVTC